MSVKDVPPPAAHTETRSSLIAQVKIEVQYLGEEEVTVRAGTFAARKFQFSDDGASAMAGEHPPYELIELSR